jgi:hypothetical protein
MSLEDVLQEILELSIQRMKLLGGCVWGVREVTRRVEDLEVSEK